MNIFRHNRYLIHKGLLLSLMFGFSVINTSHAALSQSPLFLTINVTPIVMLNISKDHQLYFKAFDDYSDLDNDGIPETTYKHSINYYGYFDSYKCYNYSTTNNRFEPVSTTDTKYCSGGWSGNFLNWASMTRIDAIRKILYGGLRSTDSSTQTVLERTYLPNDAHSFAKFYNGSDLIQLTPYTNTDVTNGITICNTTVNNSSTLSQNVTDAPLIRVAKGNYSLWAANERWQCRWSGEKSATNSNSFSASGINAESSNPDKTSKGLGSMDYVARVKVCDSSYIGTENCKTYPNGTKKPIGLLQTYGDDDKLRFGLMTGSYSKNKSGGVLRKNVSSITDEINVTTDGTFKSAPSTGGIINTLNKFRIYGYRHGDGTYFGSTGSDNCTWALNTFTDGNCSNWGNPQAEILLESLRYLSNNSVSSAFAANDTSFISGLSSATAVNPINSTEWCASLNVIQFNASTSSYDADQLASVTDLGATAMNPLTNAVGEGENIPGNNFFVGENGTDNNQLCTAKMVTNLGDVRGTCPDAPRLSGSYHPAGLAHYAHTKDIQPSLQGKQLVTTYGVALSPAIPKIEIPVPGSATQKVTILPACQDTSLPNNIPGNCAIVDFKIVHQDCSLLSPVPTGTWNCGKLYVNWEDSEQGGDFDQDQWGILTYKVSSTQVTVTTDVIEKSTPFKLGFGYILSGTTKDGFHAHSGANDYNYTDPQGTTGCVNCKHTDLATSVTYSIGPSSAASLQQPLFYAAKWGGFIDGNDNGIPDEEAEWDAINNATGVSPPDGIPDRYFFASNPRELANSLKAAFADVIGSNSSSSAVAANSTQLNTGTQVYQAKFSSSDWSGQLQAFSVNTGNGALTPVWEASTKIPPHGDRKIYTFNPSLPAGSRGIPFQWDSTKTPPTPLNTSQQNYLNSDGNIATRINWLRGDTTNEKISDADDNPAHIFRKRTNLLGDIVNSDPVFVGNDDQGYGGLPSIGGSYADFVTSKASHPMLYVGGNDGMLHGFDANITSGGQEKLAYIPNALFPELSKLTSPAYIHQYYVDGPAGVGDVYYGSAWHTLLAGVTGAGGRAVFALDVTNPDTFGAASALWEFTNANDADLGYTLTQPSVVRMQDGHLGGHCCQWL